MPAVNIIQRPDIVVTLDGHTCGEGWLKITERPNAQVKSRKYINERNERTSVTRYSTQFDFSCVMMLDKPEIAAVYEICADHLTGSDTILPLTISVPGTSTRSYDVSVQVTSIDDDDDMIINGVFYVQGDGNSNSNNS